MVLLEWWTETWDRMLFGSSLIFAFVYWVWLFWYCTRETENYDDDDDYEVDGYEEGFFGKTYYYKKRERKK